MRTRSARNIRSHSGFTLVEVMLGVGILGIFVLGIGYLTSLNTKAQMSFQSDEWLEQYRAELMRALQDETAWAQMIADPANTGFDCLRTHSDCTAVSTTPERILVKDRDGRVISDTSQPTSGFDVRGQPCTTFDGVNGSDQCPYRVGVSWRAFCAINCVNPEVRVRVDFVHKPGPGTPQKNITRYNFKLYRNSSPDTVATTCANQGGTLVGGVCVIDSTPTCSAGQAVVGFTAEGEKICGALSATYSCPPNQFLQGVDPNGNPICSGCP